jgi:hypothetical protein
MSKIRIVLAHGALADYPEGGGHWMGYLQYLLGLDDLGHDVLWLEVMRSSGQGELDQARIQSFFDRMAQYGFQDRCALLLHGEVAEPLTLETAQGYGKTTEEIREFARSADLVWNFCGTLRQPLLSLFKRRVFVDQDPGILQISALSWDLALNDHEVYLTAGTKLHAPDCEVPTLGLTWHPFLQFVYLPIWDIAPDPGPQAPFTSITQWTWEEIWWGQRVLSMTKRDAYLKYIDLPRRVSCRFELAANIHPEDSTGDRELLLNHGWHLSHPHQVAGSPTLYQQYIQHSRAEICCPKPIYRDLKTGWFSERSASYLASGRPVLAEDTGLSEVLPTGDGLLAFNDLEEAMAGASEINAHYQRHMRCAREFAEQYLGSRRCLTAMLAHCG